MPQTRIPNPDLDEAGPYVDEASEPRNLPDVEDRDRVAARLDEAALELLIQGSVLRLQRLAQVSFEDEAEIA